MLKLLYTRFFDTRNIEFWAIVLLCITAVGLPLSACFMSIGTIGLAVLFTISGHWDYKIKNLKKNIPMLLITGLPLISLLWFANTSNFKYALHDINIKHVLLVLPLAVGSVRLTRKQIFLILQVFVLATIISSLASLGIYLGIYVPKKAILNIRDITIIPHIRFGLMCVMSVCIIAYKLYEDFRNNHPIKNVVMVASALWLIYFTILLQTVTSWIVMFVLLCAYPIIYHKRLGKHAGIIYIAVVTTIIATSVLFVLKVHSDFHTIKDYGKPFDSVTLSGNPYTSDTTSTLIENGYYVNRFICKKELVQTWDSVSSIPYSGTDERGHSIGATVIRFLSSKGYTKDREGVLALTANEIKAIEHGCGSCVFLERSSAYKRVYEIIWEIDRYTKYGDPNGKSICMRIEFWKASRHIIKEHFWFGIGTGDFRDEFRTAYDEINSALSNDYRNLAICNQYLTFLISFGIFGFMASIFFLIVPFAKAKRRGFLLISFFILIMTSMISENTLDSQAGVLLFAFFYTLLLKADNSAELKSFYLDEETPQTQS